MADLKAGRRTLSNAKSKTYPSTVVGPLDSGLQNTNVQAQDRPKASPVIPYYNSQGVPEQGPDTVETGVDYVDICPLPLPINDLGTYADFEDRNKRDRVRNASRRPSWLPQSKGWVGPPRPGVLKDYVYVTDCSAAKFLRGLIVYI